MAVFFPKRVELDSTLTSKDFLRKLTDNIYVPQETGLFKINKIVRKNWSTDLYYGNRRQNAFTLFHHRPFKRDGGGVRFNGVVVDTDKGCKVGGYIRHGIVSYLFSAVWTVLLLMITVVLLVENPVGCIATLGLVILGNILIFSGSKNVKYLKAFLETLCENQENNQNSDKKE
ncbi:MAG: hypothetical protein E7509_03700 [Ruminococcus sp.]|nr:hypothetical protein [Ruminococcus sp.]